MNEKKETVGPVEEENKRNEYYTATRGSQSNEALLVGGPLNHIRT